MTNENIPMTSEKIQPSTNYRPERAMLEQPRQAGPQPQRQSDANQTAQSTAPLRRPLYRT